MCKSDRCRARENKETLAQEGETELMLPSRAMEKMVLSICELEITSALCSSRCCSEMKHGGPTDPDLLLLKRSKVISSWQLVYQNILRALQWKLRREGYSCAIFTLAFGIYHNFHST